MTNWRLLDRDPVSGMTEHVAFEGDETIIKTSMDVKPIVERNKELQKGNNWSKDLTWHHCATIDFATLQRWISEDGIPYFCLPTEEQQKYLRRKLNDSDNRYLKTTAARL